MKISRLTRLLELIGLLQAGSGQNAHSLALECGVSRRTIFRDLDVLRLAGVPLLFDNEQEQYRIPGMTYLPSTDFTPEEALSLLVICYNMGHEGGVPFHGPARSAAVKLESTLPSKLRNYLREASDAVQLRIEPTSQLALAGANYDLLISAITSRCCVRLEYDSFSDAEKIQTKLSPYRLLFSRRSWYVLGRSSLHRQTRTFHLGRILHLEVLNERFRFPRGFSIARQLRNAWHMIPEPGPDRDVVVRFEKLVARNVADVSWHKTQKLVWRKDGRLDFHVKVSGIHEIAWWILGYGDQAEVLRPIELRRLIAARSARHGQAVPGRLAAGRIVTGVANPYNAARRIRFPDSTASGRLSARDSLFISLDGGDGVGKSTQIGLLADWLRAAGHDVVTCRDPGSTPLGEAIRKILLDAHETPISRTAEMLLYMAARAQLVAEVIQPALAAGKTVISDRYLLANVVYQGHAGGLNVDELWQIGRVATAGLIPTLTVILDMPPEAAAARISRPLDRMESQGDEFRRRLREGFLAEAARRPNDCIVIDAGQNVDAVQAEIRQAVERALAAGPGTP